MCYVIGWFSTTDDLQTSKPCPRVDGQQTVFRLASAKIVFRSLRPNGHCPLGCGVAVFQGLLKYFCQARVVLHSN